MKTFRLFSMAALALAMAACSNNDDNEILQNTQQPGTMHFTATIAAPSGDATTRTAYNEVGTTINVTWEVGDHIALVHNGVVNVAEVTAVDGSGKATIEATITGSPKDNDDVYLAYPADAVASATSFPPYLPFTPNPAIFNKVKNSQDGTLAYIQNNLDLRMGSGKLAVSGDKVTLKGSVSVSSLICIWKLTLQDKSSNPLSATTQLTFKNNDDTQAGATSTAKSVYYLCVVPSFIPDASGTFSFEATVGGDTYTFSKTGLSLTAGKYYQSTVKMKAPATAYTLAESTVGMIVGSDGKAYAATDKDNLPTGVTAVAMVAYKGSDNGETAPYNHGLALALSDANGGSECSWSTSYTQVHTYNTSSDSFTSEGGLQYNDATHNTDTYPAFKAAIANNGTAAPTGCSAWFLASGYQWKKMADAAGGYDKLGLSGYYWSSTEGVSYRAWYFNSGDGGWYRGSKTGEYLVRSCLAF